jgi:hypothetical protein
MDKSTRNRAPVHPNLFIVGAAKAGTTALHSLLRQHPQVCMSSVKEPHYFADVRPDRGMEHTLTVINDREKYDQLFDVAPQHQLVGEASPSYLYDHSSAARLAAESPDARIVILLRDPVERAHSHYLMDVREGLQHRGFMEGIRVDEEQADRRWGTRCHLYLDLGLYAEQVARYIRHFPLSQILLVESDLFSSDRDATLSQIANFLQIDAKPLLEGLSENENPYTIPRYAMLKPLLHHRLVRRAGRAVLPLSARTRVKEVLLKPAPKPSMTAAERAWLQEFFRADIERLRQLSRQPLSSLTARWTNSDQPSSR